MFPSRCLPCATGQSDRTRPGHLFLALVVGLSLICSAAGPASLQAAELEVAANEPTNSDKLAAAPAPLLAAQLAGAASAVPIFPVLGSSALTWSGVVPAQAAPPTLPALGGNWRSYDVTKGEPSAAAIDRWLARYGSPQIREAPPGKTIGQVYVEMGRKYGINPAYAAAFFTKESTAGANRANTNLAAKNFGNIRWTAGNATLDRVWRSYPTWTAGMEDWFKLIRNEYIGRGLRTVDQIVPVYAPPFENDSKLYASQIKQWVSIIMTS